MLRRTRRLRAAASALAVAASVATFQAAAHETQVEGLKIVHPYTKEPATGVRDVTVLMTIRNESAVAERIVAASSPLAARAELRAGNGEAPAESIEIPAGASLKLSGTGLHIRLLGLTDPLTGYETFPLWLTFARAGKVEVEVMVEEADDAGPSHETHGTDAPGGDTSGEKK